MYLTFYKLLPKLLQNYEKKMFLFIYLGIQHALRSKPKTILGLASSDGRE